MTDIMILLSLLFKFILLCFGIILILNLSYTIIDLIWYSNTKTTNTGPK
jgi:hypothetical protein